MTARKVYAVLIRLHPRRFRERFGADMLWVFDEAARDRSAAAMLADAALSLGRQWFLRAGNWRRGVEDEASAAPAGGPNVTMPAAGRTRLTLQRYRMSGLLLFGFGQVGIFVSAEQGFTSPGIALLYGMLAVTAYLWFRRYRRKLEATGISAPAALARLPYRFQLEDTLEEIQSRSHRVAVYVVYGWLPMHFLWRADITQWNIWIETIAYSAAWILLMRATDNHATRVLRQQLSRLDEADFPNT